MNPLLNTSSSISNFSTLKSEHFLEAVEALKKDTDKALQVIFDIPASERTFKNTLDAYDDAQMHLSGISGIIYLLANTHPDPECYAQANEAVNQIHAYSVHLGMHPEVYRAVKELSESLDISTLTSWQKMYLEDFHRFFKRQGFDLPNEQRDILKGWKIELGELSNKFSRNIAEATTSIVFSKEDLRGMSDDFLKQHLNTEGSYTVTTQSTDYVPLMKYAEDPEVRKQMALAYTSRAKEYNQEILKKILVLRHKIAQLLGYETHSEYVLDELMTKKPKVVSDFLNNLEENIHSLAKDDLKVLEATKAVHLNKSENQTLDAWDRAFYNRMYVDQHFGVDDQRLKPYFSYENVIEGVFSLAKTLFNVDIRKIETKEIWHPEVEYYEVWENEECIAVFYLDMFPRENKYSHAACFTFQDGKHRIDGERVIPKVALVCNFPKPTSEQPSLLNFSQAETVFHEFGHLFHAVLTRSPLFSYSGTNVMRDFVEVPSQLFENWLSEYEFVTSFAKHYKTKEVLPEELFNQLIESEKFGMGLHTLQQVFYGKLDFYFHHLMNPETDPRMPEEISKELHKKILLTPFMEGSSFTSSFGHLVGYSSSYYGYQWSLVYAKDCYSCFKEEGVLNPSTGKRLKDNLLAPGGSVEPMDLLVNFLQREPDQKAFIDFLGFTKS